MHRHEQEAFDQFVADVAGRLLRTAELLTGDAVRARRRVDRALTRACLVWGRAGQDPTREAYRVLLSGYLARWRRPVRQNPGGHGVLAALGALSRLERASVVLCGYARLDRHDAAQALGVPHRAVADAYARGLARLGPVQPVQPVQPVPAPPPPQAFQPYEWTAERGTTGGAAGTGSGTGTGTGTGTGAGMPRSGADRPGATGAS